MDIRRITRNSERTRKLLGGSLIISRGASQPVAASSEEPPLNPPREAERSPGPPAARNRGGLGTGLMVFAALGLAGYGLGTGGLLGALTGSVAAIGVGSGLVIAIAPPEAGLAPSGDRNRARQRIGGLIAGVACLGGVLHGGWRYGWLWGIAGYGVGIAIVILLTQGLVVWHRNAKR